MDPSSQPSHGASEPIAIIGMGCRFPGHSNSPSQFWHQLVTGTDCISAAPSDRWNTQYYTDSNKDVPGKITTARCGFIDNIFEFDCEAFGISRKEAESMDTQQKILLEVTLQALEDSRLQYSGSNTGVFVGIGQAEQLGMSTSDLEAINAYSVTGSALSIAANRLSYVFDLRGPSFSVDTACSSSMTAMHYAKEAMRRHECDTAIVAGVNILLDPGVMIQFSKLGVLSPDGRCKSFLDSADGYVRSEGCGVVVLKPLSAAVRDGDHVYAVLRGTSVNSDGHRSPSLTMPAQDAQIECFKQALVDANVRGEDIFYAEAHATGTRVGDPIEANAIGKVLGAKRMTKSTSNDSEKLVYANGNGNGAMNGKYTHTNGHTQGSTDNELLIGAVKTHVGHLETASFMAGLIKCLLMLHHQQLVPNLTPVTDSATSTKLNPAIKFDEFHMRVVNQHQSFDSEGKLMMISSFGFGGSNGAAIIEGVQSTLPRPRSPVRLTSLKAKLNGVMNGIANGIHALSNGNGHDDAHSDTSDDDSQPQPPYLFVVSAPTTATLETRVREVKQPLTNTDAQPSQYALSYTLATRPLHRNVAFAISESVDKALFSQPKKLRDGECPALVWCFAGQGPQHPEMGRSLYQRYPVFRAAIDEMDAVYQAVAGESLVHDVGVFGAKKGDPMAVYSLKYTLPSLVFLQTALCDLWQSFGVRPVAVLGHSFGEMAAAYAAGVCNKKQLVTTAYHRASLLAKIDGNGVMMAVGCSPDRIELWLAMHPEQAWIAAYNGPNSITVGGTKAAIDAIASQCAAANLFHRVLKITNAYHTPLMRPCKDEALRTFSSTLAGVGHAKIPYFSTVDKQWKTDGFDAHYTWAGIEGAVHFHPAVSACLERFGADTIFMEMSAHPVLAAYLTECGAKNSLVTCHRQQHDQEALYKVMMALRLNNYPSLSLASVLPRTAVVPLLFPLSFQRSYCHKEEVNHLYRRVVPQWRQLAGRAISNIAPTFEAKVNAVMQPWLLDHAVQGPAIFPAAGYLEMMMEAANTKTLTDIVIGRGMVVPNDSHSYRTIRTVVNDSDSAARVTIHSKLDQWDNGPWTLHCSGTAIQPQPQPQSQSTRLSIPEWCKGLPERCRVQQSSKQIYEKFRSVGLNYGPLFQGLQSLSLGDHEAYGEMNVGAIQKHCDKFVVHPALLDSTFHVLLGTIRYLYKPFVPTRIRKLRWQGLVSDDSGYANHSLHVYARSVFIDDRIEGEICVVSSGMVVALIEGMECTPLGGSNDSALQPAYQSRWQEWQLPHPFRPKKTQSWQHLPQQWNKDESLLDAACKAYVARMMRDQRDGKAALLTPDSWPQHRQRYWQWCQSLIGDESVVDDSAVQSLQSMLASSPFALEAHAVERVGSNLHTLLSDPYAAQRLLFGDSLMADLYGKSRTFEPYVRLMSELVTDFIAANPHRVIHVLEIGAGTGSLTKDIFDCLEQTLSQQQTSRAQSPWKTRIKYYFTDVSQKFLHDARATFSQYSFINYAIIDLDSDLVSQGVPSHSVDLVLCFDVLHVCASLSQTFDRLQSILTPNGCLMCIELTRPWIWTELFFGLFKGWWAFQDDRQRCYLSREQWVSRLSEAGFHSISILHDQSSEDAKEFCHSIITCHAPVIDVASVSVSASGCACHVFDASDPGHSVEHLLDQAQQLITITEPTDFILVTTHSQNTADYQSSVMPLHAPHIGFARVLANEAQQHRVAILDMEDECDNSRHQWLTYIRSINGRTQEREFAVRQGKLFVPRFLPFQPIESQPVTVNDSDNNSGLLIDRPFRLEIDSVGHLTTLRYHQSPLYDNATTECQYLPYTDDEVLVRVYASALNFKDLMLALGMLSNPMGLSSLALKFDPPKALGLEFSGEVIAIGKGVTHVSVGDAVYGIGKHCLASHVVTHKHFIAKKPAHLTHTEAASMPIVFLTSYAGLIDKARISAGETVLVHSAAGGIGQASIQLCHDAGAAVIATVGSKSKRAFLSQRYGVNSFADSHSTDSWRSDVLELTKGQGVDTVINSLKGDAIPAGLSCLRVGGRFVEIGKVDILANSPLLMKSMLNDISFLSVQLDVLMESQSERLSNYLSAINAMAHSKRLTPIVDRVFEAAQVELAFRYLMSGQHLGKIIVNFENAIVRQAQSQSVPLPLSIYPSSSVFTPLTTYVLSGGTGAVALELVHYMAIHGARYFLLLSRRGAAGIRQSELQSLNSLQQFGVRIVIAKCDVTSVAAVREAVSLTEAKHYPHRLSILHLAMVLDDDPISRQTAVRLAPVLDCKVKGLDGLVTAFEPSRVASVVMFSSAASVLGNPAQSNYSAGNAYLDATAFALHGTGYTAKTINLGVVEDVGLLAEDYKLRSLLTAKGFSGGLTSKSIARMLEIMLHDSHANDWTVRSLSMAPSQQYLYGSFDWSSIVADYPILRTRFAHLVDHRSQQADSGSGDAGYSLQSLRTIVAALLGVPEPKLDENESLARQGLDSLLAVELSATLKKRFSGLSISQMELLGGMTVQTIWTIFSEKQSSKA